MLSSFLASAERFGFLGISVFCSVFLLLAVVSNDFIDSLLVLTVLAVFCPCAFEISALFSTFD